MDEIELKEVDSYEYLVQKAFLRGTRKEELKM